MSSISTRSYIEWRGDQAKNEDSDVLVLTTPGKTFVDVRLEPTAQSIQGVYSISDLEWAFAGQSSTWTDKSRDESSSEGQILHARWIHEVDSRFSDATSVVDKGIMTPGPHGTTIETGEMVNPATGKMTAYEEGWVDAPKLEDENSKVVCITLQLDDQSRSVRGIVVRVAQYCQGIVRCGDEITVERWQLHDGKWQRRVRVGDGFVPCAAAFEQDKIETGSEIKHGPFSWHVTEKEVESMP